MGLLRGFRHEMRTTYVFGQRIRKCSRQHLRRRDTSTSPRIVKLFKMRSGAYAHSRKLHGLSSGLMDWTGTTDVDILVAHIPDRAGVLCLSRGPLIRARAPKYSDHCQPLATVVIGGMISARLMILCVLPGLCR